MNETMILSLISAFCFTAAAAVLVIRKRTIEIDRSVFQPLLLSLLIYDFIVLSNFMEHAGITDYFDPIEDIAEIVFTLVFLFFINNWRKSRSEARFKALFKQAPLPLAEITRDGRVLEVNDILAQKLHELYGITVDDIPNLEKWWEISCHDPEYRKKVAAEWVKKVRTAYETDSTVEPIERVIISKDGTKRTIVNSASIVGDNMVASLVDITDLISAEEEKNKLKEQLLQSQKLEAIGNLAGGVAHDFNNMLGAIMGYAELTLEEMPPGHKFRSNLSQIMEAARRSTGLTRQLLTFARKQEIEPNNFDVNESIKGLLKMLRRLIGENIELVFKPGSGNCSVRMDPTQFDQIMANLCVNAKDAISGVGNITVETKMLSVDATFGMSHYEKVAGDYVLISVTDNGCGMSKEVLDHVFEPFFTTKSKGKGTGLGLSTVYGIIKQNQGMVNVYSEPGMGTTLNIYLPQHSEPGRIVAETKDKEVIQGRGESILIVEDDPMVLAMSSAVLERLGYTVLRAQKPTEAIDLARDEKTEIQMVVTDVVMPEMNGKDLSGRLKDIRPGIKFLFMSGYAADFITDEDMADGKINFIRKPFVGKDFAIKIREVLDGE